MQLILLQMVDINKYHHEYLDNNMHNETKTITDHLQVNDKNK